MHACRTSDTVRSLFYPDASSHVGVNASNKQAQACMKIDLSSLASSTCTCALLAVSTHTRLYPFYPETTLVTVCTCTRSPSTHTQLWHTRETTLVTVCTCTRPPSTHTQLRHTRETTWTTVRTCTRPPSTHTQLWHTRKTTWTTVYTCTRSPSSSPFHTMSAVKCNYWTSFTVSGTRAGYKEICFQKHVSGAVGGDVLYPPH